MIYFFEHDGILFVYITAIFFEQDDILFVYITAIFLNKMTFLFFNNVFHLFWKMGCSLVLRLGLVLGRCECVFGLRLRFWAWC